MGKVGRWRGRVPWVPHVVGGALLAGALVLAGLVGCTPAKRVLVIGDSLTVGAVEAGLGDADTLTWTASAEVGRGTDAGIGVARHVDVRHYGLVVIALGTNDYLDTKVDYRARVERMMDELGDDVEVVWINVDVGTARLAPAGRGVNPAIAEADVAHRNLRVGDWSAYVRGVQAMAFYRATDQVHYNRAGYALRARWMEQVLVRS